MDELKHEEVIKKLEAIERDVQDIKRSMVRTQKIAFWKAVILFAVIVLPLLALPYFINTFIDNYVSQFNTLLI